MGKENAAIHKSAPSRHSRSLRKERAHVLETTPVRSQSFGAAAASRIKPLEPHPSPAELERKHSQIRRKSSRLFGTKPLMKTPRIDPATNIFGKLQLALSEYVRCLGDALDSVEVKRKRMVEQRIKLIDSRLQQINEIFQLYLYEQKIREGSRNLLNALTSQGSKGGQDKCRMTFNNCTEKMCAIEEELESKLGVFRIRLNALLAFGRLCSGDVYDIHIKHGTTFKWKSRCKIESREGQKWIDDEFTIRPSITDELLIRVIEMKRIQANVQIGHILLRSRDYIKARPQIISVPLNRNGSMKLKMTIEWRPFSGKEENTLRAKRQSLLSEVIFVPATPSSEVSALKQEEDNRSAVVDKDLGEGVLEVESHSHQLLDEDLTASLDVVDAGIPLVIDNDTAEELPQYFRHATSLESALQHLIPTLQTHKDQFQQLQGLITLLEKLEDIVKNCTLSRSPMSLSVESALESFDFLEQDPIDEANSTPCSTTSGGSGCRDTGYNSTDDCTKDLPGEGKGEDDSVEERTRDYHTDAHFKQMGAQIVESGGEGSPDLELSNQEARYGMLESPDRESSNDDSPSCITDIFSSTSSPVLVQKSQSSEETDTRRGSKEGASSVSCAGNTSSKKLESGEEQSSGMARSSRATSPNLSASLNEEATVGNKVLDKVILCHLQFCEEVSGYLGSFGPMKSKELSALSNLRRQSEVFERLINLIPSADLVENLTLRQINRRLASSSNLSALWERSVHSSPLFTTASLLIAGLEEIYKKQIIQSYNRVSDVVFPVIVARIIHQDPDLMIDVYVEDDDIVSVYQFEHYFMDCCRRNLSKYIDEVAYELVISKRLLSPEKDAVMSQLKQYTEIPLSRTCFSPVLCLLVDGDHFVAQAAEVYLINLNKNAELRKKAIHLSIDALEESEERLREGACAAITVLQAKDSVPQLLYLSRCDVQSVKFAAKKALSCLGDEGKDTLGKMTASSDEIAGLMF